MFTKITRAAAQALARLKIRNQAQGSNQRLQTILNPNKVVFYGQEPPSGESTTTE